MSKIHARYSKIGNDMAYSGKKFTEEWEFEVCVDGGKNIDRVTVNNMSGKKKLSKVCTVVDPNESLDWMQFDPTSDASVQKFSPVWKEFSDTEFSLSPHAKQILIVFVMFDDGEWDYAALETSYVF